MKSMIRSGWRLTLTASCLAAAVIGVGMAWGQGAAAPATAPAVSAANHAAAVEAFKKARDLFQADKLAEANTENDKALQLDPTFTDATLLRKIIKDKFAEAAGPGTGTETTATGPAGDKVRLLKTTDIALLKINEFSSEADAQLRGTVDRKVLEEFWNEVVKKNDTTVTKDDQNAFLNVTNFTLQAQKIKASGDAKYMDKVKFNGDPAALAAFKQKVQPYVMQNCATSACHAGDKAGNFKLVRSTNGASDQSFYTNFYILSMYTNASGKMIDRDAPEKSLLLQYGMVKANATAQHPGKTEVRFFADKADMKYVAMLDWIKTLAFPRPNYGIVYELPGAAPAPAPATAPKTPVPVKPPAVTPPGRTPPPPIR